MLFISFKNNTIQNNSRKNFALRLNQRLFTGERGCGGLVVNTSDSGFRGRGFRAPLGLKKLLTGTLSIKQTKQTKYLRRTSHRRKNNDYFITESPVTFEQV